MKKKIYNGVVAILFVCSLLLFGTMCKNDAQVIKNIRNTSIDGRICRSPEIKDAWNEHLIAEQEAINSAQVKGLPTASIKAIFYTDTTGFFYDLRK